MRRADKKVEVLNKVKRVSFEKSVLKKYDERENERKLHLMRLEELERGVEDVMGK